MSEPIDIVAGLVRRVEALEEKSGDIARASARGIRELVLASQKLDTRIERLHERIVALEDK